MTIRPWLPWSLLALRLVFVPLLQAQPLNPSLYSSLSWRLIGPFRGGRVTAVTGVPGQPNHFCHQ